MSTFMFENALNVSYATLNSYLYFTQLSYIQHELSNIDKSQSTQLTSQCTQPTLNFVHPTFEY